MSHESVVFVVDDDAAAAASITALLTSFDFSVKTFDSAESFLNSYDGNQKGCLIVDVRLTGMSGIELQKVINDREFSLPIIMISGHADLEVSEQAFRNGAVAFLEKPFPGYRLCESIRQAFSRLSG